MLTGSTALALAQPATDPSAQAPEAARGPEEAEQPPSDPPAGAHANPKARTDAKIAGDANATGDSQVSVVAAEAQGPAREEQDVPPERGSGTTVPTGAYRAGQRPLSRTGSGDVDEEGWSFDFEGYFRAPMRVGIGDRENPGPGQSGTTYHSPIVPDDSYSSWQYTGRGRDWAELLFSYGKEDVSGTVGITGYNFVDASYPDPDANLGISIGFLRFMPDTGRRNVRLSIDVGSHWNQYGKAARYDAGMYDTFLFGRTHVMGETLRAAMDIGDVTLRLEHGIGAKQPSPSQFNTARFTLLNHLHAFLDWKELTFGAHYLHAWANEEDRDGSLINNVPDGSMTVFGPEVTWDLGALAHLWLGFSRIQAEHALSVAPAIEVIHASGGGEFSLGLTSSYLDLHPTPDGEIDTTRSGGNGAVNTLAGQVEVHLAPVVDALRDHDLTTFVFGMYNKIESDDPDMDGASKLKYGAELLYDIFPWFGVATRFDRVQPHSRIPQQSFGVISPRLLFRTELASHELFSIGYSRYFYNERSCVAPDIDRCVQSPASPGGPASFGSTADQQSLQQGRGAPFALPDKHVVTVEASMWW